MSKFFNETLKARSATLPPGGLAELLETERAEVSPAAPVQEPADEVANAVSKTVADLEVPETNLPEAPLVAPSPAQPLVANPLHQQFRGSDCLESVEESYRWLRTRLLRMRQAKGMRSIVITSAVQGEGKTLTSVNLAWCCARLEDLKVLLIDGDIRTSGLSRSLKLPPGPGLAEILSGECDAQASILATEAPNLSVMGSGVFDKSPAELFAGQKWQELINWCNANFDLILIDAPPILNLADVELMLAPCHGALMVVRALYTKREILQKCASQFDVKKLCGVVYNGTEYGTYHRYYGSYGSPKGQ